MVGSKYRPSDCTKVAQHNKNIISQLREEDGGGTLLKLKDAKIISSSYFLVNTF